MIAGFIANEVASGLGYNVYQWQWWLSITIVVILLISVRPKNNLTD